MSSLKSVDGERQIATYLPKRKTRQKLIVTLCLVFAGTLFVVGLGEHISPPKENKPAANLNISPLLQYLETQRPSALAHTRNSQLIFLLYFPDFNCPPCIDSFLELADMLRVEHPQEARHRAIAVFKPDEVADPSNPIRLVRWAQASGLIFPVFIIPDSIVTRTGFVKSCVAIIDSSGRLLFSEAFPMSRENLSTAMRLWLQ
jgi:hypothetical protein